MKIKEHRVWNRVVDSEHGPGILSCLPRSEYLEMIRKSVPDTAALERIVIACREMRRGTAMQAYRELLFEGLELGQIDALDLLVARDAWRMNEYSVSLRIEKSTVTRTVNRLEAEGFAERETIFENGLGRQVLVRATNKGRKIHAEVAKRRRLLLARVMSEFSPEQIGPFAETLEAFVAGIDRVVHEAQVASLSARKKRA